MEHPVDRKMATVRYSDNQSLDSIVTNCCAGPPLAMEWLWRGPDDDEFRTWVRDQLAGICPYAGTAMEMNEIDIRRLHSIDEMIEDQSLAAPELSRPLTIVYILPIYAGTPGVLGSILSLECRPSRDFRVWVHMLAPDDMRRYGRKPLSEDTMMVIVQDIDLLCEHAAHLSQTTDHYKNFDTHEVLRTRRQAIRDLIGN